MEAAEQIQPRLESAIGQRYEVIGPIGRGGMASVYLARHRVHGGFCAVKVLADHLAKQPPLVKSFLTEARASASLDEHPNIVNIVDIDEHAGLYYMIMKYVEGEDLSTYLRRKNKLPWRQAAYIAAEVAEALAYSHERGVIHRDLKPSNIRINRRGGITVMDFGIAKVGQTPSSFTEMGTRAGTPHYMAPEQITGGKVDHRSDLYGLGVILYWMATGKRPFNGANAAQVWQAHLDEEPEPPQELEASIPDPLSHIILTLLAKEADKRYDKAKRLVRHLRTLGLEGVAATLEPVDQLDLDALRQRTLSGNAAEEAFTRAPELSDTGPTAAPPAMESKQEAEVEAKTETPAPAPEAADETAVEPAVTPTPAAPPAEEQEPEPTAAIAERPAEHDPTPEEPTPVATPRQPEPEPVAAAPELTSEIEPIPDWTEPAAAVPEPPAEPEPDPTPVEPVPVLPLPTRRSPSTDAAPFPSGEDDSKSVPVALVVGAALTAVVAIGAFFLLSGGNEPTPREPVAEIVEPVENATAEDSVAGQPIEEPPATAPQPPAKKAAPAPPPKPAAPRTGAVYFRTEPPGARVQVGARPDWTCETPCWIEALTPGQHTVTARLAGFRPALQKIEVKAGAREPLELALEPDLISTMIASEPQGAEIYIDGEKRPEKTNARIALEAGTYQVRVVLPGVAEGEQVLVVSESQMPYASFVLEAK